MFWLSGRYTQKPKDIPLYPKTQRYTFIPKDIPKNPKVEVCSNKEGYKNAWFPAKILDPQPLNPSTKKKMNKPLVQYENLASDDDPNKLLTELVDASSIRPVPSPNNPDQPFEQRINLHMSFAELDISLECTVAEFQAQLVRERNIRLAAFTPLLILFSQVESLESNPKH